ncbi:Sec1-like protein [Hysterangium stoloniferum]|nr:Sec1-like protein [Hysterangium stoloniferum]
MPASTITTTTHDDRADMLDTSLLKELARRSLIDVLNSVNGPKTLVLDPSIAGPLGLVAEVSLLKDHGVDKMFWLESGPLTASTVNIVYLCRPLIKYVKIVADQIKRHIQSPTSQRHTYTLFLVPRVSTLATRILEEEGVLGELTVAAYNLQFIPLEEDVISMEYEGAFKEIWVDGDETAIYDSAQALLTLQRVYGMFPRMVGQGDKAARLIRLLKKVPSQTHTPQLSQTSSDKIDALIVLDRQTDLLTPLLTQLTYEGLVDEMLGIKNTNVEVPASLLAPPTNPDPGATASSSPSAGASATGLSKEVKEKKKKHPLTAGTDPLLRELRDLNFAHVGRKLSKIARRLEEDYKSRLKAKTVAQLKVFVGKLGGLQGEHQSLKLHTGLSELLVPLTRTDIFNSSLEIQQNLLSSYDIPAQLSAIEDLIAQGAPQNTVMRLICLASLTSGGIKPKVLENLKREVLQSYGYDRLPLLLNLGSSPCSLFTPSNSPALKFPYTQVRKQLRLVVEESDPVAAAEVDAGRAEDRDLSYTYSGYAPLSCRLVQCVAQKGGVLALPVGKSGVGNGDAGAGAGAEDGRVRAHPIMGWKGFEDVVGLLPGETVDEVGDGDGEPSPIRGSLSLGGTHATTTTVVFFLGGCTFSEIAGMRWMSRQTKGRRYLIATTGMMNGNGMMDGFRGT